MKAFVTGSTGLLGNNLIRVLLENGHEVKALVRSKEKAIKQFSDLPIEYVVGDMEKVDDFADELKGCDVLFHTAAYFREYYEKSKEHWQILENINIKGSIKILENAEKAGVQTAIYVSSSGTIGMKPDGSSGDENTPPLAVGESAGLFQRVARHRPHHGGAAGHGGGAASHGAAIGGSHQPHGRNYPMDFPA